MSRPTISESQRYQILVRQQFKCPGVLNYRCPIIGNCFDEAGFDIDHILPLADGGSNKDTNLQALCPSCHRVKTMRENKERNKLQIEAEQTASTKLRKEIQTFLSSRSTTADLKSTKAFWNAFYDWECLHKNFMKKKDVLPIAKQMIQLRD